MNGKAMLAAHGRRYYGRRHRRKPVLWAARLETETGVLDCVAYDFSLGGAKVKLARTVPLRRPVRLVLERFGLLRAETVWRRAGVVGLRFTEPASEVERLLSEILPL